MKLLLIFAIFFTINHVLNAQDDGRYNPRIQYGNDDGRYHRDNEGRYHPNDDGKYIADKTTRTPPTTTIRTTQRPTTTSARPRVIYGSGQHWKILRQDYSGDEDGYHYLYDTENGILAEESGKIENKDTENEGLRSVGFYEYTGDDGILYRVEYVADEHGFVPQGEHIPKTVTFKSKVSRKKINFY